MKRGTGFGLSLLGVLLLALLLWGLDGPRGVGDPRSMIAGMWHRGFQAGEELFRFRAPTVALYGSGRVVALRERRWFEGNLNRDELSAFLHRLDGAGIGSLPRQFLVTAEALGVQVADAGEIRVMLAFDGVEREYRSQLPLATLRSEPIRGDRAAVAVAEAIDALESLAARATRDYGGPIAVQVLRVTDAPETITRWPVEPAKLTLSGLADRSDRPEGIELYYEEASLMLEALAQGPWFAEEEFHYRVDWHPILLQRPDR